MQPGEPSHGRLLALVVAGWALSLSLFLPGAGKRAHLARLLCPTAEFVLQGREGGGPRGVLGVGVGAEIPTWGTMVAASTQYADRAVWTLFFPGMAIVLTALSLQILGDGVRDLLDPRLKGST